ncbi:MAG: hypothetical protein BECKG1743D_GA0114223_109752 [Candidatus Kentron sp. G]|nr:MAG: hypothetical protein BECKG1743D_GA0114223_109752 [Candidatus Kentron sp. G]
MPAILVAFVNCRFYVIRKSTPPGESLDFIGNTPAHLSDQPDTGSPRWFPIMTIDLRGGNPNDYPVIGSFVAVSDPSGKGGFG